MISQYIGTVVTLIFKDDSGELVSRTGTLSVDDMSFSPDQVIEVDDETRTIYVGV